MPNKVLLVDDDDGFRTVAALALEYAGFLVVEAPDGFTALELLRRERPDVIISDLQMPLLDGGAFCRRVRAEAELGATPFVILSAFVENDGAGSLPDVPADFCFSKQSSFSMLIAQLNSLLARAPAEATEI